MDQFLENLHTQEVSYETGSSTLAGASVLPFCVDPQWGRIYFILGKERKYVGWTRGSDRWGDFGGRADKDESTAEQVAAREFVEESLGAIQYFDDEEGQIMTDYTPVQQSLMREEYVFRIISDTGNENNKRHFVTFVKQVPWKPSSIERFSFMFTTLKAADGTHGKLPPVLQNHPAMYIDNLGKWRVKKEWLEKKRIGLWSIPQLSEAVRNTGVLRSRNGRVERCHDSFPQLIATLLEEFTFYDPTFLENSVDVSTI